MKRPIALSLSPNTQTDDILRAVKMLFCPWKYVTGSAISSLEQWFRQYFDVSYAVSFASGRGALYAILKGLGIEEGDEVILQAFTCVAVPNAVLWAGAKPVYIDVTDSLTLDTNKLEQ